jgi:hypothetical protein
MEQILELLNNLETETLEDDLDLDNDFNLDLGYIGLIDEVYLTSKISLQEYKNVIDISIGIKNNNDINSYYIIIDFDNRGSIIDKISKDRFDELFKISTQNFFHKDIVITT